MKVGSTFAGIGGFDLGFEQAGHTIAWQIENAPNPKQVLNRHWPDTPQYDDITKVNPDELEPVDLLMGGFPCQDLSVAGNRAGLAGQRSSLFYEFARLARTLTPRWLLIENVPGLLSSHKGRDMGTLVRALERLGYGWAYRTLDAQYFGVAQRRRRVFIVGHLGSPWGASSRVLFESSSLPGDPPTGRETRENVAAAVAGSPDQSSRVAGPFGSLTGGFRSTDIDTVGAYVVEAFAENQRAEVVTSPIARSLSGTGGKPGQGYPAAVHTYSIYPKTGQGSELSASKIDVSPSLTASDGTLHERGARVTDGTSMVRRLTPTECERLQGFPDGWTDGHSKTQRYRMIGNAVAVPVAHWLAQRFE